MTDIFILNGMLLVLCLVELFYLYRFSTGLLAPNYKQHVFRAKVTKAET
jgi:hypothetical protein